MGLGLREAGFHAESIWLPGHGSQVEALAKVRWPAWVACVEQHFDRLQAAHGAVALLGSSLGGSLALWVASSRPATAVVSMGGAAWLRGSARWSRLLSYLHPFPRKRPQGSAIFDEEARARHPSYPRSSMHAIAEMWAMTRLLRPRIAQIRAPLLVMHARQDSVIEPANATWIYEQAGSEKKKLLWLEQSDHIITEDVDHPEVVREAVAWIEGL